jgi:hypothetical protein
MTTLKTQYWIYKTENPKSKISYDEWLVNIYIPKMGNLTGPTNNKVIKEKMDDLENRDLTDIKEIYVRFPNENHYILSHIDMNRFKPENTYKECTFGWYGDLYIAIKNTNE